MRTLHLVCSLAVFVAAAAAGWYVRGDGGAASAPVAGTPRAGERHAELVRSPELVSLEHRLGHLQRSHDALRAQWQEARRSHAGAAEAEELAEVGVSAADEARRQDERDSEQTSATVDTLDAQLETQDSDPAWSRTQEQKIRAALSGAEASAAKLLASRCAAGLCRVELEHADRASSDLFAATAGTLAPFMGASAFHSAEMIQGGRVRMLYYAARSGTRLPRPE